MAEEEEEERVEDASVKSKQQGRTGLVISAVGGRLARVGESLHL